MAQPSYQVLSLFIIQNNFKTFKLLQTHLKFFILLHIKLHQHSTNPWHEQLKYWPHILTFAIHYFKRLIIDSKLLQLSLPLNNWNWEMLELLHLQYSIQLWPTLTHNLDTSAGCISLVQNRACHTTRSMIRTPNKSSLHR